MDLIYMNADKEDIGVLQEYELDLEIGGENDFECTLSAKSHCCHEGYFLYIEGTEYGGIIDGIKSDTGTQDVTYSGRTWHGILGSKVILPLQSTDASTSNVTLKTADSKGTSLVNRYLIVSGDANACIQYIIDRAGLSDMFAAPGTVSGFSINKYQFHRYIDAYNGLQKMLASAGLKLHLEYKGGKVIVSARERFDYSKDDSFDSDMLDFRVAKKYKTVNHLICLGAGELEKRTVIHLYADTKGNISQMQTQFGFDEYSAVYDFSAVESAEELLRYGTDELKSLWKQDELSIDFDESMDAYDVGDIVGAVDIVTGVAISSVITKKIVTIKNGKISIDLSTDSVSATGSGATGDGEIPGSSSPERLEKTTSHSGDTYVEFNGDYASYGKYVGVQAVGQYSADDTTECRMSIRADKDTGIFKGRTDSKVGSRYHIFYTDLNPPPALAAYPVGTIYMSVRATSPASLFGGSWEQIPGDRFLLSAYDAATNPGIGGATGGTFNYALVANIGTANSDYAVWAYNNNTPSAYQLNNAPLANLGFRASSVPAFSNWSHSTIVTNHGSTDAITSIIPPYYKVYMWKRIS